MKSKLAKEKESTTKSLSIEDILKEKYEETKETTTDLKKNKGRVRDVVRVSVDFPRNLYTRVVDETDKKEQTIRDFILTLVRQHFGD
jgi:flagellar basal body-associated protein FliL